MVSHGSYHLRNPSDLPGYIYVPASPETPTPAPSRPDLWTPLRPMNSSEDSGPRSRSRSWVWTLNNYTDDEEHQLQMFIHDNSVSYIVYGREVGESGTPHLQGFIQFKTRKTFQVVRAVLPRRVAHIAVAEHPYKAQEYCKKDDPNPFEFVNLT